MAITSLLYGFKKPGQIGEIVLDATISENHSYENIVTSHPIEDGSEISDHVISRPERLTMNGFITNSPVNFLGVALNLIRGIGRNRTEVAFDELLKISQGKYDPITGVRERELITIVSTLKVYTDMVMISITFPRDRTSGDSLRFTAEFQKLTKVTSETVVVPNLKAPATNKGVPTQSNGKQTATTPTTETQSTSVSILKSLKNIATGS